MTMSDDDDFLNIIDGLEIEEPTDVIDVTTLDNKGLADKLFEIEEKIKANEWILHPNTQESRDLHSLRNAIQVELSKRGLR